MIIHRLASPHHLRWEFAETPVERVAGLQLQLQLHVHVQK
jgi:hypothetical protein